MATQAQIVSTKVQPSEILYFERGPARCDRCALWAEDVERCTIHGPNVKVTGDMVCGLWVPGPPTNSRERDIEPLVTPEESGLGGGDTVCGNCRYGNGSPTCLHLSLSGHEIDNTTGCCNAWTAKPGEPSRA